ncbi:MAG: hypothetical protein J0G28_11320 [Afipia sp.]|nr:hypothetical protein [Afipia sp.]OJW64443.1 MAG: hypothetical protein BGO65_16030 [Afipia sp. 64-13]
MNTDRLTGAAKSAAGKAEDALQRATDDAANEASARLRKAEGVARTVYGQAADAANEIGENAADLTRQALDAGSAYYRQGSRAIASTIRHQPLGTLLAAGAVGFALALMLNRPSRRRHWSAYR